MSRSYILYFKNKTGFRIYNAETKEITTKEFLPSYKEGSQFYLQKPYTANDEGLIKYASDFEQWMNELKNNTILKIIYDKYSSHIGAVECTFKRLAKGLYEHHESINYIESEWIEKCYNAGLMYCKAGTYECYGYDFTSFYPSILTSDEFLIPTKRGKTVLLKKLTEPHRLQVGYYHVKIICANEKFRKLFAFSKEDVYTHISLQTAFKYQNQFDVKIDLVLDGQPNSYLYEKRDCVTGYSIFGNWWKILTQLRLKFPKNKLIKHLGSSVWGPLTKSNIRHVTYDQIQAEKLDIGLNSSSKYILFDHIVVTERNDYYKICVGQNPYRYNIRIKAFLPAAGRSKIAEVVMEDIDNCIRIQTDGVVFTNKISYAKFPSLIADEKTTGRFQWKHVNEYPRV